MTTLRRESMPVKYADARYWNKRFSDIDDEGFEWLQAPESLRESIASAISRSPNRSPKILHIGFGSSKLPLMLREMVQDPGQIMNVDFAHKAVETGMLWEKRFLKTLHVAQRSKDVSKEREGPWGAEIEDGIGNVDQDAVVSQACPDPRCMSWKAADLLSTSEVMKLKAQTEPNFSIVVDKGCADSIACAVDVTLSCDIFNHFSPIRNLSSPPVSNSQEGSDRTIQLSSMSVLALHLAILSKPGARWICLSYSSERFAFLGEKIPFANEPPSPFSLLQHCWCIESIEEVECEANEGPGEGYGYVHRPKVVHWLYTLRRTGESFWEIQRD